MTNSPFTGSFRRALQDLVTAHHSLYPRVPPQGIFFESLVERAFKQSGQTDVVLTTPNRPLSDIRVGSTRISIKTETGIGTRRDFITITKLSTTEREPWEGPTLISHVLDHLSRYEHILMLRAIWSRANIHYQLLEIPIKLLQEMAHMTVREVGRRSGRRSLGGDVCDSNGQRVFHVHFDGADGKCQIHQLLASHCRTLGEWDQVIEG